MLGCMLVREATAVDWAAIWTILKEVGAAGETLTWDPKTTEARARVGWMRDLPGRTIVAVDDAQFASSQTSGDPSWPF